MTHNAIVLHEILDRAVGAFEDIGRSEFATILSYNKPVLSVQSALADTHENAIVLTFDDGHGSDHDIALPMLAAAGGSATFFIVPEFVNTPGFMTWDQIRTLHNAGMEIGSHSMTHPDFRKLDASSAIAELKSSKARIEDEINASVISFAFPFGFAPERSFEQARDAGYQYIMGSHHGVIGIQRNIILPRNSVHGAMSALQITNVLNASSWQRLCWFVEDVAKIVLKTTLPKSVYHQIRRIIVGS